MMTHLKVCMIITSCWDSTLHFNVFYYYTYGGFGKIVERRDNIWAAGWDKNDSVAAIYSLLDDKV